MEAAAEVVVSLGAIYAAFIGWNRRVSATIGGAEGGGQATIQLALCLHCCLANRRAQQAAVPHRGRVMGRHRRGPKASPHRSLSGQWSDFITQISFQMISIASKFSYRDNTLYGLILLPAINC